MILIPSSASEVWDFLQATTSLSLSIIYIMKIIIMPMRLLQQWNKVSVCLAHNEYSVSGSS